MSNTELLSAISGLLDEKLQPIENRMNSMESRMSSMENRMDSMENRMDSMENRMDSMEQKFETKFNDLDSKIDAVNSRLDFVDKRLSEGIRNINLNLENNVIPRLQNIESCYLDTYKRYQNEINLNEQLRNDMEVVKDVIQNHSEKLKMIS